MCVCFIQFSYLVSNRNGETMDGNNDDSLSDDVDNGKAKSATVTICTIINNLHTYIFFMRVYMAFVLQWRNGKTKRNASVSSVTSSLSWAQFIDNTHRAVLTIPIYMYISYQLFVLSFLFIGIYIGADIFHHYHYIHFLFARLFSRSSLFQFLIIGGREKNGVCF